MKRFVKSFLENNPGESSSGRLIFILGSLWLMSITTYLAIRGSDLGSLLAFYTSVQGILGGFILVHKKLENGSKPVEDKKDIIKE